MSVEIDKKLWTYSGGNCGSTECDHICKKYVKYRNYKYFLEYERVQDDSLL